MKSIQEIKETIEELLKESNLFLVEVKVSGDNNIDIYIDSEDGVDISCCININRQLNEIFDRDVEDYSLTVSSAGIGYPFKVPGQFRKNIGKKVEIVLNEDNTRIEGILKSYSGSEIVVEYSEKRAVEGKKKKEIFMAERTIPLAEIKQIKDTLIF